MPLPRTKGPGRCASEGPCDPLAHKPAVKNPEKEGTNPPRSRRSPGPHSGQGRARSPVAHFGEIGYSGVEKRRGRNTKQNGKRKNKAREARKTLAASRPKKKASEGCKENPKNARGPEWHPERNAEKQDARPKRAKQQVRRDTRREQGPRKQVRVGVSCYYLSYVS